MSDSQRSWSGVKGWLDDKSSQLSRRLVPRIRRNSTQNLTSAGKRVSSSSTEAQPTRESRPKENTPPPPRSRESEWRMSSSSKFNSKEDKDTRHWDERPQYSRSKPSRTAASSSGSVIESRPTPRPRASKRYTSDQQTLTLDSASSRVDDVDSKLSRRRSNTHEPHLVQNGKVASDRQERGDAATSSDDVRRRTRGSEPSRLPYADAPPASRGRSTQGSAGDAGALENTVERDINATREHAGDMGNTLGPPRSAMSRRSGGRPESIVGQPHAGGGKLVKRRLSQSEQQYAEQLARQMKELRVDQGDARGRRISRGRSRSRSRSRDPLSTGRRPCHQEEDALREEKWRGRSLSRESRFSPKSRSVDRRNQPSDQQHNESKKPRGDTERRASFTMQPAGDPSQHHTMKTRDGHIVREDSNGMHTQRARSRSPSRNSVHSHRRLSRTPSRGSVHQPKTEAPILQHDGRVRRSSNASEHAQNGPTLVRDPGSRSSIMMQIRPASSSARGITAGDPRGPSMATSHSSSRHPAAEETHTADDERQARMQRRNSANSITMEDTSTRVSQGTRGILRRTGRSSTFTDGLPPRVPPPTSIIRPQPKQSRRSSSRSPSRSPGRGGGVSDDELRSNTMHNARNLKYQPHRDGYPSSTSPSSGRRPGLVPVRYPISNGGGNGPPPRVDRHLPLRRYTTPSVGNMPMIAMPRGPSYTPDYPLTIPPHGAGAGEWYPGISPAHEYYTDAYRYGAYPGSYPGSVPLAGSHAQYPSWPPDMRGAPPPLRRGESGGPYMVPSSGRMG